MSLGLGMVQVGRGDVVRFKASEVCVEACRVGQRIAVVRNMQHMMHFDACAVGSSKVGGWGIFLTNGPTLPHKQTRSPPGDVDRER